MSCPGCARAALKTDVHRFVYEIRPCYPGCHREDFTADSRRDEKEEI